MIGTQLGHYKIVSQLGRGGMASVFKAEQAGLGRLVAIKILQPSLAADEVIVQRFQQEARIAANLHHAHVVTIYDVGEADGVFYIAMRYIEGENLGQLLRREGPLEPNRAMRMLDQVASALDFAHSRGVLHRDIKPANVMVEPGDVLTLTDFGIARAGESSQLTATHMVIGTPEYMSPEQARGDPVDKRSDIYAMGVLMYEALGGRPPFSAASTPSLLYLHVHEPPPPLHQIRPDLPRALSDVVVKALAKNPADRYGSAQELVNAAKAALAQPAGPVVGQTAGQTLGPAGAPTVFDPNTGRGRTPAPPMPPGPGTPVPQPPYTQGPAMPPSGQGMPPARPGVAPGGWAPQGQSAAGWADQQRTNATSTLTPPPIRPQPGPYPTGPMGATGQVSAPPKKNVALIVGPIVAALALLVIGGFVLMRSGVLGSSTATPTPTAVAAKPTVGATATSAQPSVTLATAQAAVKPTVAPAQQVPTQPAAANPTEKPAEKPAEKPTAPPATNTPAPPPTPDAMARVTAAQAAVAQADFQKAIAELRALRDDPAVKNDKAVSAMVDQTLVQTHVVFGNQLLEDNKLDDSFAQFGEALKLAPDNKEAVDGQKRVILTKNYALMEANWGKDDDAAIKALEENMVLDANFKDTRQKLYALLLGKADKLLAAGDRDGAFPILMRALDVLPDGGEAQKRLATYTPTPRPAPQPQPQPQQPRPQPAPYQPAPQPQPQPQQPQQPFRPNSSPV